MPDGGFIDYGILFDILRGYVKKKNLILYSV